MLRNHPCSVGRTSGCRFDNKSRLLYQFERTEEIAIQLLHKITSSGVNSLSDQQLKVLKLFGNIHGPFGFPYIYAH